MLNTQSYLESNENFISLPHPSSIYSTINSILEGYYKNLTKPVIFDNNRAWPAKVPLLEKSLERKVKILCPVRDVAEILASMIKLIRNSNLDVNSSATNFLDLQLASNKIPLTDENRCSQLMSSTGIVGQSAIAINEALKLGFRDRLHFIEYKDLVSNPEQVLSGIYEFLGEPLFNHNLNQIESSYAINDLEVYGIKNMHKVDKSIRASSYEPSCILPDSVLKRCIGAEFWRGEDRP